RADHSTDQAYRHRTRQGPRYRAFCHGKKGARDCALNGAKADAMEVDNACRVANHFPTRHDGRLRQLLFVLPPSMHSGGDALRFPGGYQLANGLNWFASTVGAVQRRPDGSLDRCFQNDNPGKDKEVNWLPDQGPIQFDHASLRAALRGTHWRI